MSGYPLHHYLEAAVGRFPEKTAIVSAEGSITYGELWRKSGRLASLLASRGLAPRQAAGIFLHKSIDAIVTQFAILRAGAFYIPLDSSYSPLSRIRHIIASSGTMMIVSDSRRWSELCTDSTNDEIPLHQTMKVVLVDDLMDEPSDSDANPQCNDHDITGDDRAYVLYTSGSTGVPKGVMLTHENARTFIDWALRTFGPDEDDVFANIAPLHFDLSVFDVYVALACGACVSLVPRHTASNPRALLGWITENKITIFYSVPSVWGSILKYADLKSGDVPSLSRILFAGEVFPPAQLRRLMKCVPSAQYFNLYGPTETNVCTYHHVKSIDEVTDDPVPIGRACSTTEVLVLKDDDTEASTGEEGELLVRGSIVTTGYLNNARATEAAFRKSPLPHHHGARYYKTGDIVRVIEPGVYRYIGRKDLMVKCSGFRIELQEVERALLAHDAIRDAIVVPVSGGDGSVTSSIAAFISLAVGRTVKVLEIKESVARILPKYMIPETVVVLDELPRNGNGKADRTKLTERANRREAVA